MIFSLEKTNNKKCKQTNKVNNKKLKGEKKKSRYAVSRFAVTSLLVTPLQGLLTTEKTFRDAILLTNALGGVKCI